MRTGTGRRLASETVAFETQTASGAITLEWRQPRVNVRTPRYAVRAIVFERIG